MFGFLLDISINAAKEFAFIDRIIILVALFSVTISISLFVMPVVYHRVQYPYRDLEKFKIRSHRFMVLGLIPAGFTLYLGLQLALPSSIPYFAAFILAAIPRNTRK